MARLSPWLADFPGLIWSMDLLRSRLVVLNEWPCPGLGGDAPRLLRDARFRNEVVKREYVPLFVEFWDMATSRQSAAVTFRLKKVRGTNLPPLILQGWPDSENMSVYHGFLKEAFLPVSYAVKGRSGSCQMALGVAGYPVFALNVHSGEILTSNTKARDLFANTAPAGLAALRDIAPGDYAGQLLEAAARALKDDVWAGTLLFGSGGADPFVAKARLTPCGSGDGIVRVALLKVTRQALDAADEKTGMTPDVAQFSLRDGLNALLATHASELDGLIFSDILSLQGRVEVYGVGEPFADLAWGAAHSYEGTIAQDVEHFGLNSLIVDDTLDSIKSIDWVLFSPRGVRSYFAKPFFGRHGLHAVLILTSRRPRAFGPDAEQRFADMLEPFRRLIENWRNSPAGKPAG
jgi:hypothetical protein